MKNAYIIDNGVARIELTQGQVGYVDEIDLPRLEPGDEFASFCRWRACRYRKMYNYMCASAIRHDGTWTKAYAHRLVLGLRQGDPLQADHRDHDGLNNQRFNLRIVDRSGNQHNRINKAVHRGRQTPTSDFSGVRWRKERSKWTAQITNHSVRILLGLWEDELEAAKAYLRAKVVRDAGGSNAEIKMAGLSVACLISLNSP